MRLVTAVALLVWFTPSIQAADVKNPYRNAKVGDWVEYKMTSQNMEGSTKMTIVSKEDKEVTYQVESTFSFMGNKSVAPVQTIKIDLTKDYDAISAANLKVNNVKIEKLDEGSEKLEAAGKEFDTKWTKLRATSTFNGMTVITDYQMWFSKGVPLSGLVRMDTTGSDLTTRLELIGSGSK